MVTDRADPSPPPFQSCFMRSVRGPKLLFSLFLYIHFLSLLYLNKIHIIFLIISLLFLFWLFLSLLYFISIFGIICIIFSLQFEPGYPKITSWYEETYQFVILLITLIIIISLCLESYTYLQTKYNVYNFFLHSSFFRNIYIEMNCIELINLIIKIRFNGQAFCIDLTLTNRKFSFEHNLVPTKINKESKDYMRLLFV